MTEKCIICNAESSDTVIKAQDFRLNTDKNIYRYTKCSNCGLIFLNHSSLEKDFIKYYPAENYYKSPSEIFYYKFVGKKIFKKIISKLKSDNFGGKLLDVGCGTGIFLNELQKSGYDVLGIDNSHFVLDAVPLEIKDRVQITNLKDANYPDCFFDIVVIRQVIEHLMDPNIELEEVYRILKPDGLLYIEVPNYDCIDSKIFGHNWYNLEVPRHLCQFNFETICELLKKSNFSKYSKINGLIFLLSSPLSIHRSVQYLAIDKKLLTESQFKVIEIFIMPITLSLTFICRLFSISRPLDLRLIFKKSK